MNEPNDDTLVTLAAEIVSSHVAHNDVAAAELPGLISEVHAALAGLGRASPPAPARAEPAVPIRSSVKQDYIVCLEDGKKLKMLKRYVMTRFGLTPDEYRAKWGLPADYPMVAPAYAEKRRSLAREIGLGTKRG